MANLVPRKFDLQRRETVMSFYAENTGVYLDRTQIALFAYIASTANHWIQDACRVIAQKSNIWLRAIFMLVIFSLKSMVEVIINDSGMERTTTNQMFFLVLAMHK